MYNPIKISITFQEERDWWNSTDEAWLIKSDRKNVLL